MSLNNANYVPDIVETLSKCNMNVTLSPADTSGHDQYLDPLFKEKNILSFHAQDNRIPAWLRKLVFHYMVRRAGHRTTPRGVLKDDK